MDRTMGVALYFMIIKNVSVWFCKSEQNKFIKAQLTMNVVTVTVTYFNKTLMSVCGQNEQSTEISLSYFLVWKLYNFALRKDKTPRKKTLFLSH